MKPYWLLLIPLFGCIDNKEEAVSRGDDLYLETSEETAARVSRLLPTKGSQDAKHVLGTLDLSGLSEKTDAAKEYLPSEACEWVLDIKFKQPVDSMKLAELFDKPFREKYGSCMQYGKDSANGLWTFLVSKDGPQSVTALKVTWDYYAAWIENPTITTQAQYAERIVAVKQQLQPLTGEVEVTSSKEPAAAAARSLALSQLSQKYDRHIAFYLVAPKSTTFKGKDVWDVMLSLGLEWGDMDCFHWINESGVGDDYHFSVETSTAPGYFLPERIAVGKLNVEDLVFVFSLPRAAAPVTIAERMDKAVQYAKQRLGGDIRYTIDGQVIHRDDLMQTISTATTELTGLGFPPGAEATLRFF